MKISASCKKLLSRAPNQFDAFFFDFDGTIADSANAKKDIFYRITPSEMHDHVSTVLNSHSGMTRGEIFHEIAKAGERLDVNELMSRFSKETQRVYSACEVFQRFDALKLKFNVPFYILSSAPSHEVMSVLSSRSIDIFFEDVFHASNKKRFFEDHNVAHKETFVFFGDGIQDKKCENLDFIEFIYCQDWADGSIAEPVKNFVGSLNDILML